MQLRTIEILYFAVAEDLRGAPRELLELPSDITTVADLLKLLEATYESLRGATSQMRVARNERFAALTEVLADGDVVALIPPVAGG